MLKTVLSTVAIVLSSMLLLCACSGASTGKSGSDINQDINQDISQDIGRAMGQDMSQEMNKDMIQNIGQIPGKGLDLGQFYGLMPDGKISGLRWWQKTIAYEIYVKSFKDSDGDGIGDINGITSQLDHLKSLGVGAVWLTPCYASPQADNGYDIADYYRIDPAYGTMEDMDRLIKEARKRGIRIVMDLVFNHTSDEHEWFKESRSGKNNDKSDWYIWADPKKDGSAPTNWRSIFGGSAWEYDKTRGQYYLHTFLKEQPDLNWANPEVRRALINVANYWVRKGVGGFRMDAISYIKKPDSLTDGKPDAGDGLSGIHAITANLDGILDYLHEFKSAVRDGNDIFTVGEANGVLAEDLPEWVGPDGVFDMVFEFNHVNIDIVDEVNWCKTRDWTLPDLKAIFAASQKTTLETGGWYPMFLENHDQPRSINRYLPGGAKGGSKDGTKNRVKDADRTAGGKALATLLLTMRGTPFIMQGEELGFVNVSWPHISDYEDISTKNHYKFAIGEGYSKEEAMQGVHRFSRDNARTPMQWTADANAGFTTGEPWLPVCDDYKEFNAASESEDENSVLNWYVRLAKLRSEHPELIEGNFKELFADDDQIFAFVRERVAGSATDKKTVGKSAAGNTADSVTGNAANKSAAGNTADKSIPGKIAAKSTILINMSTKDAEYDASCVENAQQIAGTKGKATKGKLRPLEAVIYSE